MRLVLHDANLDSNAKLVIGEAAIANGWWDGMAWEDKQAVLENDFQQTIFEALRANGDWAEMSFDEKKAILYSNTPEKMAETMANLGLWDEYQPEIKNLGADNTKLLEILLVSEDRMKNWNELPDDVKEIMADNYDLTEKIYQSERMFNAWKEIPDSEKKMLANNEDVLIKILNSENALKDWNSMPEIEKKILGNNSDLLTKVYRSEDSITAWNKLPINVKAMLGDNVDILSKVRDGTISVDDYNKNVIPNLKVLYGDNTSLQDALKGATDGITTFNQNAIPSTKTMVGVDAASGPADNAFNSVLNFKNNLPDLITKTVQTQYLETHSGPVIPVPGRATGDPYFQGGPVWLGDGGKAEPYLTPQGQFGISPAEWTMFNLPRGTKIWPSVQKLVESLPRYANGTQFDSTGLSRLGEWYKPKGSQDSGNNMASKFDIIINLLNRILSKEPSFAFDGIVQLEDKKTVGRWIAPEISNIEKSNQRFKTIREGGRT